MQLNDSTAQQLQAARDKMRQAASGELVLREQLRLARERVAELEREVVRLQALATDGNPLSRRIRDRRKALHLTQAQVADMLDVSNGLISLWETGRIRVPTYFIANLARALSLLPGDLS